MVQYREDKLPRDSSASDYWKLAFIEGMEDGTRSTLRSRIDPTGSKRFLKSSAGKQACKTRLKVILPRTWQGFIIYETCAKTELKAFTLQRRIKTGGTSKKDLIAALEIADEAATFENFFKLPAEIRVLIYKTHFDSFSDEYPLCWAKAPPVTQVCSLMRHAALELFNATCEFGLRFSSVFITWLGLKSQTFLRSTPAPLFGAIRKLTIIARIWNHD